MIRVACMIAISASTLITGVRISGAQAPTRYEIIIRHGTLFDGTGASPIRADVAISNGRIVEVGDLSATRADREIDATGLFVAPGFINIHDHADPQALPVATNMLLQGVTTSIVNPDGQGPLDIREQVSGLASKGMAVNVGAAIGFNSAWAKVVGVSDRRPNADDLRRIGEILKVNLAAGAWAVSAGLDYKPGYFATTAEVIQSVTPAGSWRTIFPNHDRLRPEAGFSSLAAIKETLDIGKSAGVGPIVTHIKAQGTSQGSASRMLRSIDAASAPGRYAGADVYPYLAGQSGLGSLFVPAWAADGGPPAFFKRLGDPALRARIVTDMEQAMTARLGGPGAVSVLPKGTPLTEVMAERHVSAGEAIVQLLLERPTTEAILRFGREDDLRAFLRYPRAAIACDCGASDERGVHPRYWGTFPRVLGYYVREQRLISWSDAIRKMTGLPATMIGLTDRGFLALGMAGDVTIFDPATIIDKATYEAPTLPSIGVRWVLVNGNVAVEDGRVLSVGGGRALYRASYMPSRLETVGVRRWTADTRVSAPDRPAARLKFALSQGVRERTAKGSLSLSTNDGALIVSAKSGILQRGDGWFGITGIVTEGRLVGRAFSLIGDRNDPLAPGRARLHLLIDGEPMREGEWRFGRQAE